MELIEQVFNELKGNVQIGDIVSIYSDKTAYRLTAIENGIGTCETPGHLTKYYPVSELANVNAVKQECVRRTFQEGLNDYLRIMDN